MATQNNGHIMQIALFIKIPQHYFNVILKPPFEYFRVKNSFFRSAIQTSHVITVISHLGFKKIMLVLNFHYLVKV